jgi:hypothetical protein
MLKVVLPKTIKIGGHDYILTFDSEHVKARSNWGETDNKDREITFSGPATPQQISGTFIHECLHAIDWVYGRGKIKEDEIYLLGEGLLQVLEQLGVRFVRAK